MPEISNTIAPLTVQPEERDKHEMYLWEQVADGAIGDHKFSLGRTMNGLLLLLTVGDRQEKLDLAPMIQEWVTAASERITTQGKE